MADQRMRLKCTVCGELFGLAKRIGTWRPVYWDDELQAFFDKHHACRYTDGRFHVDHFELDWEEDRT